jgi:superfamily II DNA or RNA helicase
MSYSITKQDDLTTVSVRTGHLISSKDQVGFRTYHDSNTFVKKHPYHYFSKENCFTNDIPNRERVRLWNTVLFEEYVRYLGMSLHQPQTILTNRGFELYKPHYDTDLLQFFRKELTVTPRAAKGYGPPPDSHDVYIETDELLIVPRYYGYKNIPDSMYIPNLISIGDTINVPFNGSLRENQIDVVETFRTRFPEHGGGLIVARCAFGKTAVANYMISMMGRKTLVIVHKENLLMQWKERIEQFLPTARVGKIQGNVIDTEDKDVVIGMIQSLCKKEYGDLFKQFGMVICDEAHRTGAKEFCNALRKTSSCYTLGLTATPTRTDGLTKVFKWYLGEVGYTYNKIVDFPVSVEYVYYKSLTYREMKLFSGGFNFAGMIKQIVEEGKRTEMIVSMAVKYAGMGRQILIIGHRLNLLRSICKLLQGVGGVTHGFYIGGMKEAELNHTKTKQIILGSYSMIEEGADIPTLDTIILATPKSNVQQAVGRIMRQKNKHDPLIIDIVDDFSIFPRQAHKRQTLYKKEKYSIEGYRG